MCDCTGAAAGSSRAPLAEVSSSPSDAQLRAVKEATREMLAARNWTGSATVASLQARMSLAGHNLSEEQLIKVSHLHLTCHIYRLYYCKIPIFMVAFGVLNLGNSLCCKVCR